MTSTTHDAYDFYDVAVIGGGPAGATVAALLAESGRRVVVFEKSRHPRFHIGESLLPKNLPILERLGVAEEIRSISLYKPGAEFVSPEHEARQAFYFGEALDPSPDHAYQVERARFDEILLRNARRKGAEVREDTAVTAVDFEESGCRLTLKGQGAAEPCRARFLVDASGRDGLLARQSGARWRDRNHNSAAMFAHFEGVAAEAWSKQGNIAIYMFEHGWIWMIPLRGGLTSVGAVCMPDYLKTRKGSLDDFFLKTLALCPKAWAALREAKATTPVRGAGNYSYRAERAYGDGFLLVGDAYVFIDPIFSSGVFLAMSGTESAAAAIDQALENPRQAERLFRDYQRWIDRGVGRLSWFIYRFNTPAMRNLFMAPRNVFGVRNAVVSLLAGDICRSGGFSWKLSVFKAIYYLSLLIDFRSNRLWRGRWRGFRSVSTPEDEVAEAP